MDELTAFQRDILSVLAREGPIYGIGIKRQLEEFEGYHYDLVNHGRMYPNLDKLADRGFVKIGSKDYRTNEYSLTERGEAAVAEQAGVWAAAQEAIEA